MTTITLETYDEQESWYEAQHWNYQIASARESVTGVSRWVEQAKRYHDTSALTHEASIQFEEHRLAAYEYRLWCAVNHLTYSADSLYSL